MKIAEILIDSYFKDEDLPVVDPVITIGGKTFAYPANFVCINGMPKSFKTTFAFFFLQSALEQKEIFTIKVNLPIDEKIILIDTEQSLYDFTRQIKNLKFALNVKKMPKNFSAYLFRKYDPDTVIKSIHELIQREKPKIIIIDN
jgi:KaiC/GvpD/RAD55 family RecA-like ATPase